MSSTHGQQQVTFEALAQKHGVSVDAVRTLSKAVESGHGRMAQFSHPDLGGMGQWSKGGMIMIGEMNNHALKARVDALCNDLADHLGSTSQESGGRQASSDNDEVSFRASDTRSSRWPASLGTPSSTGSQNDMHYAVFPRHRRLAIEHNGKVTVYDSGDHEIHGAGQAQGADQTLTFRSQHGLVRVKDLRVVQS